MILIQFHYRAMSLLGFLWALMIFSGIYLAIGQWGNSQRQSAVRIYQVSQAIQIAQNQKQRLFLGLECQHKITQNNLVFRISCNKDEVKVSYIAGEISL